MVQLPDGTRHWPRIGSLEYRKIAPIKRFQMVQTDATTLELRLLIDKALTEEQQRSLRKVIHEYIAYPFEINFRYVNSFPPGKFEEFISHVTMGHRSESS